MPGGLDLGVRHFDQHPCPHLVFKEFQLVRIEPLLEGTVVGKMARWLSDTRQVFFKWAVYACDVV